MSLGVPSCPFHSHCQCRRLLQGCVWQGGPSHSVRLGCIPFRLWLGLFRRMSTGDGLDFLCAAGMSAPAFAIQLLATPFCFLPLGHCGCVGCRIASPFVSYVPCMAGIFTVSRLRVLPHATVSSVVHRPVSHSCCIRQRCVSILTTCLHKGPFLALACGIFRTLLRCHHGVSRMGLQCSDLAPCPLYRECGCPDIYNFLSTLLPLALMLCFILVYFALA